MASLRTRAAAFALFDTALGTCGIAWGDHGIAGTQLPEADVAATRTRLQQRFPSAKEAEPPPEIADVIVRITALFRGQRVDLTDVTVDMASIPNFERDVYRAAREIRPARRRRMARSRSESASRHKHERSASR